MNGSSTARVVLVLLAGLCAAMGFAEETIGIMTPTRFVALAVLLLAVAILV